MNSPQSVAATPAFELHAAVRRQPWAWLDAIVRRLSLAVEIVDERGLLCAPIVVGLVPTSFRKLLSAIGPATLRSAFIPALHARERQRVSIEGLDVLCVPLSVGQAAVGLLLIARNTAAATPAATSDAEIDSAAAWLARAIEAQLDVPPDDSEAFDRVSSLHRLLHEAVEHG